MRPLFPWSAPPGAPRPAFVTPVWWQVTAPIGAVVSLGVGQWPWNAGYGWPAALAVTVLLAAGIGASLCAVWQGRARAAIRAGRVTPTTPRPFTRGECIGVTIGFALVVALLFAIVALGNAWRAG